MYGKSCGTHDACNKRSSLDALELQVANIVALGVCSQARANSLRGVFCLRKGSCVAIVAALFLRADALEPSLELSSFWINGAELLFCTSFGGHP